MKIIQVIWSDLTEKLSISFRVIDRFVIWLLNFWIGLCVNNENYDKNYHISIITSFCILSLRQEQYVRLYSNPVWIQYCVALWYAIWIGENELHRGACIAHRWRIISSSPVSDDVYCVQSKQWCAWLSVNADDCLSAFYRSLARRQTCHYWRFVPAWRHLLVLRLLLLVLSSHWSRCTSILIDSLLNWASEADQVCLTTVTMVTMSSGDVRLSAHCAALDLITCLRAQLKTLSLLPPINFSFKIDRWVVGAFRRRVLTALYWHQGRVVCYMSTFRRNWRRVITTVVNRYCINVFYCGTYINRAACGVSLFAGPARQWPITERVQTEVVNIFSDNDEYTEYGPAYLAVTFLGSWRRCKCCDLPLK